MATFNFDIKNQSYEIALKQTKESLLQNDTANGAYYLDRAIALSEELIAHCIIPELKRNFTEENKKLKAIRTNLVEKGINPFLPTQKQTAAAPAGGGAPRANAPQNASASNGKAGEKKSLYFSKESPDVTLKDIAGLDEVKRQIRLNVIAPLNDPELYFQYKDEVGCQILMYGPPGCGKSFVAEAIAGELKCAYAIINTYDILDKYVGEAPKKILQIFEEAKEYDNCLIFFDELDALFASRESDDSSHTKDVLTSFLTCLSGFNTRNDGKKIRVVIGATNRPWILDSALLRGKRFDTHIYIGLPDADARLFLIKKAFKKHGGLLQNTDITAERLVELFDGYSCADISSMLDKMKSLALSRALENKANGVERPEPVTYGDARTVLAGYRNSVTKESLAAFEAFKNGEI